MRQDKLTYLGKRTTVAQNADAVHLLDAEGVGVITGFILGVPGDTIESLTAEYRDFEHLPLLVVSPSILGPDPGTREYVRAKARGGPFLELVGEHGVQADPDRHGIGVPYGLPPMSDATGKDDLNLLLDVVQGHFNTSDATWARFHRDLPADREDALIAYLSTLRERALRDPHDACHPAVLDLAAQLRARAVPWPVPSRH
jgi:hypothetical protein